MLGSGQEGGWPHRQPLTMALWHTFQSSSPVTTPVTNLVTMIETKSMIKLVTIIVTKSVTKTSDHPLPHECLTYLHWHNLRCMSLLLLVTYHYWAELKIWCEGVPMRAPPISTKCGFSKEASICIHLHFTGLWKKWQKRFWSQERLGIGSKAFQCILF